MNKVVVGDAMSTHWQGGRKTNDCFVERKVNGLSLDSSRTCANIKECDNRKHHSAKLIINRCCTRRRCLSGRPGYVRFQRSALVNSLHHSAKIIAGTCA